MCERYAGEATFAPDGYQIAMARAAPQIRLGEIRDLLEVSEWSIVTNSSSQRRRPLPKNGNVSIAALVHGGPRYSSPPQSSAGSGTTVNPSTVRAGDAGCGQHSP